MGEPRRHDRIRRLLARGESVVPWLALVGGAVGLGLLFRTQGDALGSIGWETVALSAPAFAVAPLLQGLSFAIALRVLTQATLPLDAMLVWSRSYVARYAPTGALALAYRLSARRRLRASVGQVLAAFSYEHVAVLAAAGVVCLLLNALAGASLSPLSMAVAIATLVLAAAARSRRVGRALRVGMQRLGFSFDVMLQGRQLGAMVVVNAFGWLGTGAGVYLLVAAVTGSSPPVCWLVGLYVAGYLVGFVAPLAPGGLGVREGALVVLLGPRYGVATAIAISLSIRLANVIGELLAVALVHGVYGARRVSRHSLSLSELTARLPRRVRVGG